MKAEKEKLYMLLAEIHDLVVQNEKEDGSFYFDIVKAMVVLDFAKTEIQKSIQK